MSQILGKCGLRPLPFGKTRHHVDRLRVSVRLIDRRPARPRHRCNRRTGIHTRHGQGLHAFGRCGADALTPRPDQGQPISETQLKSALKPEAIKHSDLLAICVGQKACEAAGGTVIRDLFSETVYVTDLALLDDRFAEALEAARAALVEEDCWPPRGPFLMARTPQIK